LLATAVVLVVVSCLLSALTGRMAYTAQKATADQAEALNDAIERADAERCVTSWERVVSLRESIAEAAKVPAEALIAVASDADPANVATFRAGIDAGIKAAVEKYPDPECDLDAAHRRLDR
jgi:hypothetical protein